MRGLTRLAERVGTAALVLVASGAIATPPPDGDPSTNSAQAPASKAKILYELGVQMSGAIQNFQLSESEFDTVKSGIADGYRHRADLEVAASYEPQMQQLLSSRVAAMTEHEKRIGRAYLAKAEKMAGARKTVSGLV